MVNRIIFYLVLTIAWISAFGQTQGQNLQAYVDSLKHELVIVHHVEQKIDILNEIGARYLYSSPDSTLLYAEIALQLSEEIEQIGSEIRALGFLGEAYKNKANLPRTWN